MLKEIPPKTQNTQAVRIKKGTIFVVSKPLVCVVMKQNLHSPTSSTKSAYGRTLADGAVPGLVLVRAERHDHVEVRTSTAH
jgi:hypothetical protein